MNSTRGEKAPVLVSGILANLPQFSLLVIINAFVGAMAGMERSVLPLMAISEFGLTYHSAIVAFIVSAMLLVALVLMGNSGVLAWLPDSTVPFFSYLSFQSHFESLGRGVIDTRDVIYYLSAVGFFLTLTVWSVESRKWR